MSISIDYPPEYAQFGFTGSDSDSKTRVGFALLGGYETYHKLWKFCQSNDTLYCPANENMVLDFISGGYIPGGMLVDQIAVKKVE